MADVQNQLELFHDRIRTGMETNATLRLRRDEVVARVAEYRLAHGLPRFTVTDRGSYATGTGTHPTPGIEYDIDVALVFHTPHVQHSASDVRGWVASAVSGHGQTVEDQRVCVRVRYPDGYHVDLACYAWYDGPGPAGQYHLARKFDGWSLADPDRLIEHVREARTRFRGTEDRASGTDQFCRCVRYLRRWEHVKVPAGDGIRARGLAHVLYAAHHLPSTRFADGRADDRGALEHLSATAGNTSGRLTAPKPHERDEDAFLGLSDTEMEDLKRRFTRLHATLAQVKQVIDPARACELMRSEFGPAFPGRVPRNGFTASSGARASSSP